MEKTDKIIIDGAEHLIEPSAENVLYNNSNVKDELDSLNERVSEKLHLHILVLGNSYSADSFMYVPFILKQYGIDVTIGIYVRAGGGIDYLNVEYASFTGGYFWIDSSVDESWHSGTSTPQNAVKSAKQNDFQWDIIVLQQGSAQSVTPSEYNAVGSIISKISADVDYSFLLGWNINHTRKEVDQPQTVLDNIETTCDKHPISIIFPYGTAVFNARNSSIKDMSDGGDLWSNDEVHLQDGLPCYVAAIANVECIFRHFYPQFGVLCDQTRPTTDWFVGKGIAGQNGTARNAEITNANCLVAQKCAIAANRFPFTIQTSV